MKTSATSQMVGATDNLNPSTSPQPASTRAVQFGQEQTTIAEQMAWLKGAAHGFEASIDSFERVERNEQTLSGAKLRLQRLLGLVKMYEEIRPRPGMKK